MSTPVMADEDTGGGKDGKIWSKRQKERSLLLLVQCLLLLRIVLLLNFCHAGE